MMRRSYASPAATRCAISPAGANVIVTLWPVRFSNDGTVAASGDRTAPPLSTRMSAALAAVVTASAPRTPASRTRTPPYFAGAAGAAGAGCGAAESGTGFGTGTTIPGVSGMSSTPVTRVTKWRVSPKQDVGRPTFSS